MDEAKIRANINAREAANELMEFVPDVLKMHTGSNEEQFWEIIATTAAAKVGKVLCEDGPVKGPMTEAEALAFEKQLVPKSYWPGGRPVGEVEPWQWLNVTEDKFSRELRRYLGSPHFRRRQ